MNALLVEIDGDSYYTGDLEAGKALARRDRIPFERRETVNGVVYYRVTLNDSHDPDDQAEWGSGATGEEAWRYALGAMFGPIDAEYDEPALRAALEEEG